MKTAIASPNAPAAIGPYSQAIVAPPGRLVFLSGQIPLDPATGQLVEGSVEAQTQRVLDNLAAVLAEAGSRFDHVVKTTIFLKDLADFAKVNALYAERFSEPFPARATVEVARLPRDVRVEIDAVAVIP